MEVAAAPPEDPAVSEAGDRDSHPRHGGDPRRGPPRRRARQRGRAVHSASAPTAAIVASAAESGTWTAPTSWPIVGVHVVLLPNGKSPRRRPEGEPAGLESRQWYVRGGAESHLAVLLRARAPAGWPRVLRRGPHQRQPRAAGSHAVLRPPTAWSTTSRMARGRWYPTATVLGNGDVVILAGRDEAGTRWTSRRSGATARCGG